jgi:hypothetical protein
LSSDFYQRRFTFLFSLILSQVNRLLTYLDNPLVSGLPLPGIGILGNRFNLLDDLLACFEQCPTVANDIRVLLQRVKIFSRNRLKNLVLRIAHLQSLHVCLSERAILSTGLMPILALPIPGFETGV